MGAGKKLIVSLWLVFAVLVSVVLIAPRAASPDSRIAQTMTKSIDGKIGTTLELAAASSAASLAVSALPGDTATPVAEKLADFGSGFLIVLCVLYFEKSLFTVIGYILFVLIIPAALFLLILSQFRGKRLCRTIAGCLMISGILFWLMIPAGLAVSDMVYTAQQSSIQETITSSGDLSMEIEEGTTEEAQDGAAAQNGAKAQSGSDGQNVVSRLFSTVSTFSSGMVKKAKNLITGFLKALALMIVTACVIPILVMAVFLWIIKLVFEFGFIAGGAGDVPLPGRKRI